VPQSSEKNLTYYHGTTVAGLIAGRPREPGGPVGVAPAAGIIDVRVYDTSETDPTEGGARPDADTLAAGLEWVAENAGSWHIKVANVSLAVRPSKRLAEAVRKAWDAGVVIVASAGNRPTTQGELNFSELATFHPGEDAAKLVYPAGYPHVVAVNATAEGAGNVTLEDSVLHNSQTDVAAPTYRAVSVAINGSTCLVPEIATSWSAAEVSGVLALIRSRYPHDGAAEAVARLVDTASGSPTAPTSLEGAGVVQPVEALTRPLPAGGDPTGIPGGGRAVARATAPEPQADVLAATRDHAVWWGLLGGGALLLAVLARPALARRRDAR
jgi:membrane-anchored mycosin MYCP